MSEVEGNAAAAEAASSDAAEATASDKVEVTDETGGVTQEEIDKALGSKYKTVAPVTEEAKKDDKVAEKTEEDTSKKVDTKSEQPTGKTDAKATKQTTTEAVATDPNVPDFSFTVKDASGTSFKITPGDSIEDVLEDFDPKNNGQIIAVLEQLREAKDKQANYEADQAKQAQEAETAKSVESIQTGWQAEFKEFKITDDARQAEVMKYMSQQNDKRQEAGKPLITTVEDALLGLEKQEAKTKAETKAKEEKETARKNGGLVGGSSAPATSSTAPVYKSGSAKNATQALRAMGVL